MSAAPLRRTSVVDELAADLRGRIVEGELAAGTPLREVDLAAAYAVSRHTLRAALRVLAGEGLVRVEPNRGAAVAELEQADVVGLWELRTALEVEAARLALERDREGLLGAADAAAVALAAVCARPAPPWETVADAHDAVHRAIVEAAASPRILAAWSALAVELRLFLVQLRPVWSLTRMDAHHRALVDGLAADGPDALRDHLREGAQAVLAPGGTR